MLNRDRVNNPILNRRGTRNRILDLAFCQLPSTIASSGKSKFQRFPKGYQLKVYTQIYQLNLFHHLPRI